MSIRITEIEQSLQVAGAIKDPVISNGTPIVARRKQLAKYSGGFAVVFPFDVNGTKWAFRCWTSDIGNVERRLRIISQDLRQANLTYFVPFEYEAEGLEVDGRLYPTTRMKWIEGENIKDFICNHSKDAKVLLNLADKFVTMCKALHNHNIAHGDLQHGNILVDTNASPILIDYDSVYTPNLIDQNDVVKGLPDYQHPTRKDNKYANEKLDYFSELVIYLSIIAVAENPSLIRRYKLNDAEHLLFSAEDFKDLEHSDIFFDLQKLSEKVKKLLSILQIYLSKTSILDLEPFDVVYARMMATLKLSKEKIRKAKEKAVLSWEVVSADKIVLFANGNKIQECKLKGSLEVAPDIDTEYSLKVYDGTSSNPEERKVSLLVRPEAIVEFFADKEYTLPTVPIKLSWNVKNALSVIFDGKEKNFNDSVKIVEGIEKETEFEISVTDEFETKKYFTKVRMLPIPLIQSLLIPTPNISSLISINASLPIQFKSDLAISINIPPSSPQIDLSQSALQSIDKIPQISIPSFQSPKFELERTFYEKLDGICKELVATILDKISHINSSYFHKTTKNN